METKTPIKIEIFDPYIGAKEQEARPILSLSREDNETFFTLKTRFDEHIKMVWVDKTRKGYWISYRILPFDRVRCFLSNKFLMKIEY